MDSGQKNNLKIYQNYPGEKPVNFKSDELAVFIDDECLININKHLSSDKNKELGGVITGFNCELLSGEKFVYIKNFIKAEFINSSLSRLTFTPETWQQINEELEKKYPDEIIIGWYHSHPGHTVFLSEYDIFIQKNFFNLYFNVAYVYDPVIDQKGFYIWKNDEIIKTENFSIVKSENIIQNKPEIKETDMKSEFKPKTNKNIFLFFILFINLAVTLFLLYQVVIIKAETEKTVMNLSEYENIRRDLNTLNQKLEDYIIETELNGSFIEYEIKPGDNIKGIAFNFLNDSNRYIEIIKLNNLKSEDDISALTKIKIPMNK